MKFLHIKTNNLVNLVGRNLNDKIDWLRIGCNPKDINLNNKSISQKNSENTISYILPIKDETKAQSFVEECVSYGVQSEIVDETTATSIYDELIAYKESLNTTT